MIDADDLPAVQAAAPSPKPRRLMQSFAALDISPDSGFAALVNAVTEVGGEPITLEQAKAHLRVVAPDEDTYISDLILTARQMAEGRLNRTLVQRQLVEVFDGRARLTLPKPPIVSVDMVVITDYARAQTTLDTTDFYLDTIGGNARLQSAPGRTWLSTASRSEVAVTYTAGYAPGAVPQPIVQWMLLVIGSLYENRETMSAGVEVFSIPDNFMSLLLQPYMVYE